MEICKNEFETFTKKSDDLPNTHDDKVDRSESKFSSAFHQDQNIVIVHLKRQYFQCTECKQEFLLRKLLQSHNKKFHDDKKPELELEQRESLQCTTKCDKVLPSQASLQTHLDEHDHEVKKRASFQCKICERTFAREANLKIHVANTHGEIKLKTFQCNICQKVFERKDYLCHHTKRVHASKSLSRPHQCHLCSTFRYQYHQLFTSRFFV